MSDESIRDRVRGEWAPIAIAVFVGACVAAGLILILYRIRGVFLPFLVGFFIAYVLDPLLDRLEARGWSRTKAVLLVMAVFLLLVGGLITVVVVVAIVELPEAVQDISEWGDQQVERWENREDPIHRLIEERVRGHMPPPGVDGGGPEPGAGEGSTEAVGPTSEERVIEATDFYIDQALTWLQDRWGDWAGPAAKQLGTQVKQSLSFLLLLLLIPLIAFHFMHRLDAFRGGLARLVPEERRDEVFGIAHDINDMLGRYLRGLGIVSVANGVSATAILAVLGGFFGTEYWLVVGAITGMTYCVPWLGPTLSTLCAGVVGVVTADHHHLLSGLLAAGCMVALNLLFDNAVMPRIVGQKVGLHPLAVLFGIMAGYAIWGILGMIVAVPVTASINIAMLHILPAFRDGQAAAAEANGQQNSRDGPDAKN